MEKLQEAAEDYSNKGHGYYRDDLRAFTEGAQWQQQHSKEVIEELVKALEESNTQIEYLHQKFKETGTGNAVLSRNSTIIQKHRNNEKQG